MGAGSHVGLMSSMSIQYINIYFFGADGAVGYNGLVCYKGNRHQLWHIRNGYNEATKSQITVQYKYKHNVTNV